MTHILALILAGAFFLLLPGSLQAQKASEPPAIPPMLEKNRPLAQTESQEPEGPAVEDSKGSKTKAGAAKSAKSDSTGKSKHKKTAKKKKTTKPKKKKSGSAQKPQSNGRTVS